MQKSHSNILRLIDVAVYSNKSYVRTVIAQNL